MIHFLIHLVKINSIGMIIVLHSLFEANDIKRYSSTMIGFGDVIMLSKF